MSLASRIADRLVLKPSRDYIDPETRRRHWVEAPLGKVEVWICEYEAPDERERALAIKFPGAFGRAERGGPHPFECWPGVSAEVWTVNMSGYGGSPGRATLATIPELARSVWTEVQTCHAGARPLVIGNSIGCSAALYLAANFDVGAVMLRNPVPLKELILGRHSWWNGGFLTRWLVRELPAELDPIENARRCRAPAFVFSSSEDRLVPTAYQDLVIDGYAGPKQVYTGPGIGHHDVLPDSLRAEYCLSLDWLNRHRLR